MKIFLTLLTLIFTFNFQSKAQEITPDSSSHHYKTFSNDGAWCWFSDPRAVYLNGKTYSGWVSADGSIMVNVN